MLRIQSQYHLGAASQDSTEFGPWFVTMQLSLWFDLAKHDPAWKPVIDMYPSSYTQVCTLGTMLPLHTSRLQSAHITPLVACQAFSLQWLLSDHMSKQTQDILIHLSKLPDHE